MNTKRIIFLMLSLIALSGTANAQTTMDSLRRYIWEYIEEGELKMANSYMDFTETTVTDTDEWLKEDGSRDWNMGTDIDTSPYYLKPLEPGYGFDESKIGKVRNGRIIVVRNPGGTLNPSGSVSTYLIRSLTDRELIITCLENLAVTTRWKAVARPTPPPPGVSTGIDFVLTNNSGHRFNVQSVALWGNLGLEYTPFIDCQPGTIAGYSSVGFPAWRGKDLSAPPGTPITDLGLELYLSPLSSSPQAVRVTVRIDGASGSDSELLYRDGDTMLTYIELPGSDTVTPKSGRLTLRIEITDYFGYEGWRAPAPAKLPVDSLPAKR